MHVMLELSSTNFSHLTFTTTVMGFSIVYKKWLTCQGLLCFYNGGPHTFFLKPRTFIQLILKPLDIGWNASIFIYIFFLAFYWPLASALQLWAAMTFLFSVIITEPLILIKAQTCGFRSLQYSVSLFTVASYHALFCSVTVSFCQQACVTLPFFSTTAHLDPTVALEYTTWRC